MSKKKWINLKMGIATLISGLICAFLSSILDLDQNMEWWFLFGSCCCFYSVMYSEFLESFFSWWKSTPKFKGFKYWLKKALKFDIWREYIE